MSTQRMMHLPDNKTDSIRMMMTPDTKSQHIRGKKTNSVTRLLATTFTFKSLNKFDDGVTQRNMQETYEVQAKQLATCITGCKSASRKRHASDDTGPSSKK